MDYGHLPARGKQLCRHPHGPSEKSAADRLLNAKLRALRSYFEKNLKKGEKLELRYRIFIVDTKKHSDVSVTRYEKKYWDYIEPSKVTVSPVGN